MFLKASIQYIVTELDATFVVPSPLCALACQKRSGVHYMWNGAHSIMLALANATE